MYYFIINPISGRGHGKKVWKLLEPELKKQAIVYQPYILRYKGEAREIGASLSKLKHPFTAVVVGGDGSINEFLSGLTSWSHITFGCIPIGTGNDFVRGLSLEKDPLKALERILHPVTIRNIKVGRVQTSIQTQTDQSDSSSATIRTTSFGVSSGIGFDADVCNSTCRNGIKDLLNFFGAGKLIYLFTALRLLISMKQSPMTLLLDDRQELHFEHTFFAAMMNLRYEGGGFMFAPEADPTDDCFTLCIAEGLTRTRVLRILPLAFSGKHVNKKGIHVLTCKKAVIRTSIPLCVHTDGEILGFYKTLTVEAAPDRLPVIS